MKKIAFIAAVILTASITALTAQETDQPGAVVTPVPAIQTDSGLVEGKMLGGVKAWLGIPYAKAPVNALRWKPPQPIRWDGVYHADRKMPACPQILRPHGTNHYFGEEATSEDCLFLNMWAPADAAPGSKLPVIVYLYGGGATIGSANMAMYDGTEVAKRGAILVVLNYRLGILGLMAHPELTAESPNHASGNYALMDQNAALRWVRANIAKFGGDPAKVALAGQSAGAVSVTAQLSSPLSRGLFRAAMMDSGCNWSVPYMPLASAEAIGLDVQKRLGAANLAQMRDAPADKLVAMQNETQLGARVQGVRVTTTLDGYFLPKSPMEALAAHENNDVPIIAGFTRDEATNGFRTAKTVGEYNALAEKTFGPKAAEFLKLYPVKSDADIGRVGGQEAREAGLEGSARQCAILAATYNKSPAYIGMFSRPHPYVAGVTLADQNTATAGAYHGSDNVYWFGTQDAFNLFRPERAWTDYDRDLSRKMTAMLIAFARTGDPSIPGQKWPAWSARNEQKIDFGNDAIAVVKLNTKGMDFLAAQAAGAPPP